MYENGQGVAQNYAEAVKWYRKAADKGFAQAQFNLGLLYYQGRGVDLDDVEAVKWFRKSADQGVAEAEYMLGFMYDGGIGVQQNDIEAMKWFQKAVDHGFANAKNALNTIQERKKREEASTKKGWEITLGTAAAVILARLVFWGRFF